MESRKKLGSPAARRSTKASPLGERLRILFKKERLSRMQLAKHLKLTNSIRSGVQILYRMETREKPYPKLEYLMKIAKYFDVSLHWLITGPTNSQPKK